MLIRPLESSLAGHSDSTCRSRGECSKQLQYKSSRSLTLHLDVTVQSAGMTQLLKLQLHLDLSESLGTLGYLN